MSHNCGIINFTFHDGTTAISDGNALNIGADMVTINVYITGDTTETNCVFEGKDEDGNWYPVNCANLSELLYANQTSGINEVWQADLSSWIGFRVRVEKITTGSITIKWRVTN
jgi:hypothetical protein